MSKTEPATALMPLVLPLKLQLGVFTVTDIRLVFLLRLQLGVSAATKLSAVLVGKFHGTGSYQIHKGVGLILKTKRFARSPGLPQ